MIRLGSYFTAFWEQRELQLEVQLYLLDSLHTSPVE